MAYGENPGEVISIKTALTYDKNVSYGHESAGKDLALAFDGGIAADGEAILGKFLDLDKNQEASVMFTGQPMILRKTADTINPGDKVIGAGAGKIKSSTAGGARGRVFKVLETGDNGRVLVFMPA